MRRSGRCVAMAAGVLLGACGGDGGTEAASTTLEELTTTTAPEGRAFVDWQDASRAVCEAYDARLLAIVGRLSENASDAESIAIFDELLEVTLDYVNELLAVPIPTERTLAVERLNDKLERGRQSLGALRSAFARGDYGGFQSSLGIIRSYADTDQQYLDLGVPECTPDD